MKKHSLKVRICLADFAKMDGQKAVETVFELIEKVYAAVKAKSGKVVGYQFSNEPDPVENFDGNIATLLFDVRTPYECELELTFQHVLVAATQGHTTYPLLDLQVTLL